MVLTEIFAAVPVIAQSWMKSMATDAPDELKMDDGTVSCIPASDCHVSKHSPSTIGSDKNGNGERWCGVLNTCYKTNGVIKDDDPRVHMKLSRSDEWVQPKNIADFFTVIRTTLEKGKMYRLIAGNTGSGVYPPANAQTTIDITALPLYKCSIEGDTLKLGGCIPLAKMIDFLRTLDSDQFAYAEPIAKHLSRVANTPIRNVLYSL
ncbi:putative aldehyde oxidase 3 [Folsomia candida]|uniref:Putative aldehyde oxidase 3 n=1 Tax=Folsomia candida TaxID=158441 RepID=A0A226D557_FOLCA|nr:putative aldehyde oxidase 3 [Folsomia candida]